MEQAREAAIMVLLPSKHPGKPPYPSQKPPSQQLRRPSSVRPRAKIAPFTLRAPACAAGKQTTPNWDGFAPRAPPAPRACCSGGRRGADLAPPPRERDPRQEKPHSSGAASATEPNPSE